RLRCAEVRTFELFVSIFGPGRFAVGAGAAASEVAPGMTLRASAGGLSQLVDVVEEAEHALLQQRRGAFVVVGQAVVGEQVSIAGVQEQLCAVDRLDKLARGWKILHGPLVALHHVDLEGDSRRPGTAELRGRESSG